MSHLRVDSHSTAETTHLGKELGHRAQPGDVVCLIGDLGAGKTHFTQGIAVGLGLEEREVTSPTFALIAEHEGGRIPLYHMDAYRLVDSSELGALGFDDYLARRDGILVIEWADRIADSLPAERLEIEITAVQEGDGSFGRRILNIRAHGRRALEFAAEAMEIL